VRRMHLVTVSDGTAPASALIRVDGEIDLATEPELRAAIAHAIDDGCRDITVDLSGVSFMDCAGVNALLWCRKHVGTADGHLSLGQVSPCAARILTLTGLDHELSAPTES
jgi:anti-sigma B factor antagonist